MGPPQSVIRACMLYEFKLGSNAAAAGRKICQTFGEGVVTTRTVQRWFNKFKDGDETLEDAPRAGRPTQVPNEELQAAIEANSGQTCEELGLQFSVSRETIRQHLHQLGKHYKLGRWVPHDLTPGQKATRAETCVSLLSRLRKKPFLDRVLTCDEKWVLYEAPRRRYHWLASHEPVPKQPKPALHQKKVLLCVWWTARGIVHRELLPAGQTINATVYCQQLSRVHEKLKTLEPALLNRKGVLLLHDPHVARMTRDTILRLGWETLLHPPYSPDIAPSDYHLFHSLDNHLRGRQFKSLLKVQNALDTFFASRPTKFYRDGIHGLPGRWQKVVDADGDYF